MMPSQGNFDPGEPFVPEYVSARLRAARGRSGRSVRDLARAANVSPSFISQVENGKAKPSVGTLLAIVLALDMSLDELFSEPEPKRGVRRNGGRDAVSAPAREPSPDGVVLRAADRHGIDLAGGVRWERLTPSSDLEVGFLHVTYAVGGASSPPDALMRHSGREYGVVLEGHLGAQIGSETYELGPGDSVTMDCSIPHRYWAIGSTPAKVVWAIVNPPRD